MLVVIIAVCEAGFWVLLALGLLVRYGLRWRRTSVILLAAVPVVDLVLLVATVVDLRQGGVATPAHGLAAAYIAFSVVFGHGTIRRIDAKVAHRFAGGPKPEPALMRGPGVRVVAWQSWRRALAAWSIATVLLGAAIVLIADPTRTSQLVEWILWLSAALGLWLLAGPLCAHLLGRRFA